MPFNGSAPRRLPPLLLSSGLLPSAPASHGFGPAARRASQADAAFHATITAGRESHPAPKECPFGANDASGSDRSRTAAILIASRASSRDVS